GTYATQTLIAGCWIITNGHHFTHEDYEALAVLLIDIVNIFWSMASAALLVLAFVDVQPRKWRAPIRCDVDAFYRVARNPPLTMFLSSTTRETAGVTNNHGFGLGSV